MDSADQAKFYAGAQLMETALRRSQNWRLCLVTAILILISTIDAQSGWAQDEPNNDPGKTLDKSREAALAKDIQGLLSPDFKTRNRSMKALVKVGRSAIPPLITALRSANLRNSFRISAAISEIGRVLDDAWPVIAKAIDDEKNPKVRRQLVDATRSMGNRRSRAFLPSLMKCLESHDSALKETAAKAIGRLRGEAEPAVPALLKLLNDKERPQVKRSVIVALGQIGGKAKKTLPVIQTFLTDNDPGVRSEAIKTVSFLEGDSGKSLPAFIKGLEDEDKAVQFSALYAVMRLGSKAKAAVSKVQQLTKSEDEGLRATATSALLPLVRHDPAFVKVFTDLLDDKALLVRVCAVTALGKMGAVAKAAVPNLIQCLNEKTEYGNLEAEAAFALGKIGEKQLSVPALKRALKSPNKSLRRAAKRGLQLLGVHSTKKTLDPNLAPLYKALNNGSYRERRRALADVIKQGKDIVPALLHALTGFHSKVQSAAVEALQSIADNDPSAIPEIAKGLESNETKVRSLTVFVIGSLGEKAKSSLPTVLKALKDPDPQVRQTAVSALATMGDDGVRILIGLVGDKEPETRRGAVEALKETKAQPKQVITALGQGAADSELSVRLAALRVLGSKKDPAAVALLQRALNASSPKARSAAAASLGRIGRPISVPALPGLMALFQTEKDSQVKQRLIYALGRIGRGRKNVIELLVKSFQNAPISMKEEIISALKDMEAAPDLVVPVYIQGIHLNDRYARETAIQALSRLGKAAKSAVPELKKVLSETNSRVVIAALQALGAIGPDAKAALPEIEKLLKHPNKGVRYTARFTLAKIDKS